DRRHHRGDEDDELGARRRLRHHRRGLCGERRAGRARRAAVPGAAGERMTRVIGVVDTTMRDGNQSLWSATGLTTPDVLAIAPTIDKVGYHACDFTSSTHMAVSVRFHREDPWERIRLLSAAMPNTPLSMITPGVRFISWVPAEEDVIALALKLVVSNGIRRLQIADPSNDVRRLRRVAEIAKTHGMDEVVIGLTYS